MTESANELYAELYDASVPDWPGEIDFYRALAAEAIARGEAVLELACGTGRVALRLAQAGTRVVGAERRPRSAVCIQLLQPIQTEKAQIGQPQRPLWQKGLLKRRPPIMGAPILQDWPFQAACGQVAGCSHPSPLPKGEGAEQPLGLRSFSAAASSPAA